MKPDYSLYTFVTSVAILVLQLKQMNRPLQEVGAVMSVPQDFSDQDQNSRASVVSHAPPHPIVDWDLGPVYESGDIPHPSYMYVSPEGEPQPALDIMAELLKLRVAANTQRRTLTEANRMPPETSVSRMIAEQTRRYMAEDASRANSSMKSSDAVRSQSPLVPGLVKIPEPAAGTTPSENELPMYLDAFFSNRVGVILGVGKGEFVSRLLKAWKSTFLYLVDPYIHIWRGYDEPSNVDDKTHQMIFETLRSQLVSFEGKHMFIRDFSSEFAKTYKSAKNQPAPGFIWIDANPSYKAVMKDLSNWFPILGSGGLIGGTHFAGDTKRAVEEFALLNRLTVSTSAASNDSTYPIWLLIKN